MCKCHFLLKSLVHAILVFGYVYLVSWLLSNGQDLFGRMDNISGGVMILMLLVLSAAITGLLVFGRPVVLFLDNKKKEAVKFLAATLAWLLLLMIGTMAFMILNSQPVPDYEPGVLEGPADEALKNAMIMVDTPRANETVTSPMIVSGQARGAWYFEASFPYEIIDAGGNILDQGFIMTDKEWMTEDFVPFSKEIELPGQSGDHITLILRNDNPSGLPENAEEFRINLTIK